jgi:hypothetical protein
MACAIQANPHPHVLTVARRGPIEHAQIPAQAQASALAEHRHVSQMATGARAPPARAATARSTNSYTAMTISTGTSGLARALPTVTMVQQTLSFPHAPIPALIRTRRTISPQVQWLTITFVRLDRLHAQLLRHTPTHVLIQRTCASIPVLGTTMHHPYTTAWTWDMTHA